MKFFTKKSNSNSNLKDNFINPKVLEVNLVKDEVGVEFNWNRHILSLFLVSLAASLLIWEIYYGLDWWQKQEEQKTVVINAEYEDVGRQIRNIDTNAKDFTIFKDKLALTKKMADTHIYWTDFFTWLENNTLNSVTYDGFSGNTLGNYSLSAKAKTFSDISWQTKTFRDNKSVDLVSVDSGTSGQGEDKKVVSGEVSFSLSLKVKPEIFYRQPE